MKIAMRRWLGLGLIAFVSMQLAGCKSDDELSGTPWNKPKSWESGLPSAITEGR